MSDTAPEPVADGQFVTLETPDTTAAPAPAPAPAEAPLPEKFAGKSVAEIVHMYTELESAYGRQSNETGELRALISQHVTAAAPVRTPEELREEFIAEPETAVARAVESAVTPLKRELERVKFEQAHPDYKSVVADPNFRLFTGATEFRRTLHARGNAGDYASASELLKLYADHKAAVQSTQATSERKASAATSVPHTAAPPSSPKLYRASDIMRLHQTDPEEYRRRNEEITRAYAENRVIQ